MLNKSVTNNLLKIKVQIISILKTVPLGVNTLFPAIELHALMIGAISWERFIKLAERGGDRRGYMITLQSPFNLLYLALKAWFNSIYWDEGKCKEFRDQTLWAQMFYKLSPKFCGDSVEQMVLAINLSMTNSMRHHLQAMNAELNEIMKCLPQDLRNKFPFGVLQIKELKLKNNASGDVEQCLTVDLLYDEEYEPQGVYHYLRFSEFYSVLSYIPNQKRFIFNDL